MPPDPPKNGGVLSTWTPPQQKSYMKPCITVRNIPVKLTCQFYAKVDLDSNCANPVTHHNWPAELTPLFLVLAVSLTPESYKYEAAEDSLSSGCLLSEE